MIYETRPLERRLGPRVPLAERAGRDAHEPLEDAREMRLVGESGLERDLREASISSQDGAAGPLDPQSSRVLPDRTTFEATKGPGEINGMDRSVACQLRQRGSGTYLFTKPLFHAQEPGRRPGLGEGGKLSSESRHHVERETLDRERSAVVVKPHLVMEPKREHRHFPFIDLGGGSHFQLELPSPLEPEPVELDAEEPAAAGGDLVAVRKARGMEADAPGTIAKEPPADGLRIGAVEQQREIGELVLVAGELSLPSVPDVREMEPPDPRVPDDGSVELARAHGVPGALPGAQGEVPFVQSRFPAVRLSSPQGGLRRWQEEVPCGYGPRSMIRATSLALLFAAWTAGATPVPKRDVSILSEDGFRLKATLYSAGAPGPGMLLLHQCNRQGPLTGYESLAPRLAQRGFQVLVLDSRGFGESRNDAHRDYHSQMELIDSKVNQDVEAAYRFLGAQPLTDRQRIAVAGASCGAWQAIALARKHIQVRALVFISGTYLDLPDVEADYQALTHLPVLAIYSEEDRYRTPESMKDAFTRSKNEASRLIAYKGAAHGTPLLGDENLETEIVGWLETRLRPAAPYTVRATTNYSPTWSPDGRSLAFESEMDGKWVIARVNEDGTDFRVLTDGAVNSRAASWSPRGQIAFTSDRDGTWDLYVMEADGSEVSRITRDGVREQSPRWSPDGRRIAYRAEGGGRQEIYTVRLDGSAPSRVMDPIVDIDGRLTWTPDGRIAFFATRSGERQGEGAPALLWTVRPDGTHLRAVTREPRREFNPSWAPDGRKVAFDAHRNGGWESDDGGWEIWVRDADGTRLRSVTDNSVNDWAPAWSPDGSRIAYCSGMNDRYEIWVMEADGSNARRVTHLVYEGLAPGERP
jgi:Tol biopolymer transport system component/dienelactone hydrolase